MTIEFIIRILVASIIGGIIGLEREYRAKEAGFRTHFLVALGSALFMVVSQYGFDLSNEKIVNISLDPSRIASQVVTGIGFIGAGIIIFQKHVVRGLTTAAGLWVTSAIGLACGSGLYTLAITSMILVLVCLEVLHFVVRNVEFKTITATFSSSSKGSIIQAIDTLRDRNIDIRTYSLRQDKTHTPQIYLLNIEISVRGRDMENVVKKILGDFDGLIIEEIG